jgi:hypothetical protein
MLGTCVSVRVQVRFEVRTSKFGVSAPEPSAEVTLAYLDGRDVPTSITNGYFDVVRPTAAAIKRSTLSWAEAIRTSIGSSQRSIGGSPYEPLRGIGPEGGTL